MVPLGRCALVRRTAEPWADVVDAADRRPSLLRPSLFALSWHLSVWVGLLLIVVNARVLTPAAIAAMGPAFLIMVTLAMFGELRPLVTAASKDPDGVPFSGAFVFAALYMWGPAPAILIEALCITLLMLLMRRVPWRFAFNVGQYVVSVGAACGVVVLAGQATTPFTTRTSFEISDMGWLILSWLVYHFVNLTLVAMAFTWPQTSFWNAFTDEFMFYTVSTLVVLALSPLVVLVANEWFLMPLLLLPLQAVYHTAKTSREKEYQALHDSLTDLPNRSFLGAQLESSLDRSRERDGGVALFFLDLDRFKEVNDTLGHHVGDRLLEIVAKRIQGAIRPEDTVGRLGGDEFAVLLPGLVTREEALEAASRIRTALEDPIRLDGVLIDVEASIGVALHPLHGSDPDELMRRADVAMYVAKAERTRVEVYDAERDPNSPQRLGLVAALREALENGNIALHYQPKISLVDGHVVGVEALARWHHRERGVIPPLEFVTAAERSTLVHELTSYVLDTACRQASAWWRIGMRVPIAVNVSMRDLQDTDVASIVARTLDQHGLPSEALMLEVTESIFMSDPPNAVRTLSELREIGVRSALDDFGTGYSSLILLEQLPVSEIKIDQSFVMRLGNIDRDPAMVRSIVGLAHGLGLTVVAEGVETDQIVSELREMGCDAAQGFELARPMSSDQATRWLVQRAGQTAISEAGLRVVGGQGGSSAAP